MNSNRCSNRLLSMPGWELTGDSAAECCSSVPEPVLRPRGLSLVGYVVPGGHLAPTMQDRHLPLTIGKGDWHPPRGETFTAKLSQRETACKPQRTLTSQARLTKLSCPPARRLTVPTAGEGECGQSHLQFWIPGKEGRTLPSCGP